MEKWPETDSDAGAEFPDVMAMPCKLPASIFDIPRLSPSWPGFVSSVGGRLNECMVPLLLSNHCNESVKTLHF